MRRALSAALLLALAACAAPARADAGDDELFARGVAALGRGTHDEAIDAFEALADRGFVHPDASFDRALAYVARVRAGDARPGDLGRAAAALEETLAARPDDAEAERALDVVRAEVARRGAHRSGGAPVDARPTLDRALVGLASEATWAALALVGSALLAVGLALRARAREGALHLAGVVATPLALALLVVTGSLAWGARHLRATTRTGVVVASEVRLLDDRGVPRDGVVVPEAARLEVGAREGDRVHVRWGAEVGLAPVAALRIVARP